MTGDWRDRYAAFLVEKCSVPDHKVRYFLHWLDRFLATQGPGDDSPPDAVARFLDQLAREKEPWKVRQAEEAVRLHAYFRQRQEAEPAVPEPSPPAATPAASAEWDHLASEMVRVLRLQHLSLRTEKSYLGWLRRFRTHVGERPPAALSAADVERFLSHLAVDQRVAASTQNQAFSALLFLYRHV